ncbi:MAG: peptide deformylase [Pseudomonadota bacterium]
MKFKPIVRLGDKRIYRVAEKVNKIPSSELDELIKQMFTTMQALNGIGIAAPQIGVNQRVIIIGFESSPRYPNEAAVPNTVLINPSFEPLSQEKVLGWEGCLSIPGMRGVVPRYKKIKYRGFDSQGNLIQREAENLHARIVQHECDHIDGKLYPCHIEDWRHFGFEEEVWQDVIEKRIPNFE